MDINGLRQAARCVLEHGDFTLWDIWIRFSSYGGDADALDVEAFIHSLHTLSDSDVVVLGLALKELRNAETRRRTYRQLRGRGQLLGCQ